MSFSRKPLKRFGQNFLTNVYIQKKIVSALEIAPGDTVIEIGPGQGALTEHIVAAGPASFYAVEIDPRWCRALQERFGEKVTVLQQDVLEADLSTYGEGLKIIGNIPYNITSPILFKLIDAYRRLSRAVLMTQKEVALRLAASPGNKDYGILSVITQTFALTRYLFEVKRGNFFPRPEVDSAVVQLDFYAEVEGLEDERLFRSVVRHCFNYRRKMLRNSLSRIFDKRIVYSLKSVNIDLRPEQLSVQDFKHLTSELCRLTTKPFNREGA